MKAKQSDLDKKEFIKMGRAIARATKKYGIHTRVGIAVTAKYIRQSIEYGEEISPDEAARLARADFKDFLKDAEAELPKAFFTAKTRRAKRAGSRP
jgi:hypothetical protein